MRRPVDNTSIHVLKMNSNCNVLYQFYENCQVNQLDEVIHMMLKYSINALTKNAGKDMWKTIVELSSYMSSVL